MKKILAIAAVGALVFTLAGCSTSGDADKTAAKPDTTTEASKAAEPKQESTAPAEPTMTTSQKNAVAKAKDYLDLTGFSHDGLIKQLEFEKFSTEDATFAADNCGADWNAQAAKKAAEYLELTSFSHDGLVEQLVFEGFTAEQAEHGATSTGL